MNFEQFQHPQRQSAVGILLIFSRVTYKFVKSFWVFFILIFFTERSEQFSFYSRMGLILLILMGIVYSYFYYQRFLYHIDYEKEEFVLEKGVFSTNTINIPFDKIQQVDLKRSILQRMIGVYSLVVDTAGSKGDEISIRAISEEKANALSSLLTKAKNEKQDEITKKEGETEEKERPEKERATSPAGRWVYHLGFLNLLKVGLTRSYLRGFLL